MRFIKNLDKILLLGTTLLGEYMDAESMEQRSRKEVGGIDQEFFQRQWELRLSPITHFTANELKLIYEKTSLEKSSTAIPEEAELLLPQVLQGNPVALFELAQRDGGKARLAYNGEKKKLLLERGVLLLISTIKGENTNSKLSLDFAADTAINYDSLTSLETIIEKAKELAPRL